MSSQVSQDTFEVKAALPAQRYGRMGIMKGAMSGDIAQVRRTLHGQAASTSDGGVRGNFGKLDARPEVFLTPLVSC